MSAPNVTVALAAVMAELPAIGKDGRAAQQQGGYSYRGIEQITAAAAPLLAKHGVVFVPQVLDVDVREITVNGKPWTDTTLLVRYRICGPGGPGDYVEATVVGIGRDNTDKGANKALTQAFKYALTQVLCIADAKDDADGHTHEADARTTPQGPPVDAEQIEQIKRRADVLPDHLAEQFAAWKGDQGFPWPWPVDACTAMSRELDRLEAIARVEADPEMEPF